MATLTRQQTLAMERAASFAGRAQVGDLWRQALAFLGQSRGGMRLWVAFDGSVAALATFLGFRWSPAFAFA